MNLFANGAVACEFAFAYFEKRGRDYKINYRHDKSVNCVGNTSHYVFNVADVKNGFNKRKRNVIRLTKNAVMGHNRGIRNNGHSYGEKQRLRKKGRDKGNDNVIKICSRNAYRNRNGRHYEKGGGDNGNKVVKNRRHVKNKKCGEQKSSDNGDRRRRNKRDKKPRKGGGKGA